MQERGELKFVWEDTGAQFVMTPGMYMTLRLCVDSLDTIH